MQFFFMIIWVLISVILASLVLPLIWVIKLYQDTGNWKYNLLRALYGNLSGLLLIGATWRGHQYVLTNSPDFGLSSYLSFFFLIPVALELYRTDENYLRKRRLLFYSTLVLGIIFYLVSVFWQVR